MWHARRSQSYCNITSSWLVPGQWDSIVQGYSTSYPATFRPVIPFLLASIVFHKQWLIDNLHANHPLFISPLWTSVIFNNLSASVLSGTGRNSRSLLTATGVPPHILLANEIAKVYSKLEDVKTELIGVIKMNNRCHSFLEKILHYKSVIYFFKKPHQTSLEKPISKINFRKK